MHHQTIMKKDEVSEPTQNVSMTFQPTQSKKQNQQK